MQGSAVRLFDRRCGRGVHSGRRSSANRDISRIHGPDLIRSVDAEVTKQVRVDTVCLFAPLGAGFAVDGMDVDLLITLLTCLRPTSCLSVLSISRSIRAPAKGGSDAKHQSVASAEDRLRGLDAAGNRQRAGKDLATELA